MTDCVKTFGFEVSKSRSWWTWPLARSSTDGRGNRIARELGLRDIPTIYVGRLKPQEREDLRLAVNLYRRHLTRAQMRELIAWALRERPESSDRCVAGKTGVNHRTVAGVRKELEARGEILHLPERNGQDGKKYPAAAKPTVYAASSSEGRRAKSLLDRLGDDAPPRPTSIRVLHKLLNRKDREALKCCPEAHLPAHIKIECCDFKNLAVTNGSLDLIFTDPPWGKEGRRVDARIRRLGCPQAETRWRDSLDLHRARRAAGGRQPDRQEAHLPVDPLVP